MKLEVTHVNTIKILVIARFLERHTAIIEMTLEISGLNTSLIAWKIFGTGFWLNWLFVRS